MSIQTAVVIFAIWAALGLVAIVALDIVFTAQEAEAKGCPSSIAANASKGRCVNPGG
jgi:multidrug transporter EmrE-like cation transporter